MPLSFIFLSISKIIVAKSDTTSNNRPSPLHGHDHPSHPPQPQPWPPPPPSLKSLKVDAHALPSPQLPASQAPSEAAAATCPLPNKALVWQRLQAREAALAAGGVGRHHSSPPGLKRLCLGWNFGGLWLGHCPWRAVLAHRRGLLP